MRAPVISQACAKMFNAGAAKRVLSELSPMPCRMLVAVGELPMTQLLNDFRLVALNRNEQHELNRTDPAFIHSGGWGIVLGQSRVLTDL